MAAFGFRPVRLMNGTAWNGAIIRHSILSGVAIACVGDLVDLAGTASISPIDGSILADLSIATAGSRIYGAITGFIPTTSSTNLDNPYGATGAYRECYVALAEPNLVFECVANSALVTSAIGQAYDPVCTAGTATTQISGNVLDSTAGSTGKSFQWVGVRNDPANLATLVSGTTLVANTTVIEVVCVEPSLFPTQLGTGV